MTQLFENNQAMTFVIKGAGVLTLSLIAYLIAHYFILKILQKIVQKTKTGLDDLLFQDIILRRLSYLAPIIVIHTSAPFFTLAQEIIRKASFALLAWLILLVIGGVLSTLNNMYVTLDISRGRPIKGYIQVVKLFIYCVGTIIIISSLVGHSPMTLLGGFGAMTAVLLLIFRDTILSFIASLQISSNDLVRVGDWIEVPKFGADGDVMDIALHTVKIQNWDKTITVIPTHKLIDETFKNWRGMKQSGGRRIKRAILIDIESVRICDDALIARLKKISLITEYVQNKLLELETYNTEHQFDTSSPVNGRRMTNIGTFRAYVEAYLRSHEKIHQGMTFLIRQLPPGPNGLPLEIYVFTNDTAWANYEAIQADIFDHILAVVPEFDLRIFQNPTGRDFCNLSIGLTQREEP
jgi:miniconductance mechanosensitive channel